MLVSDNLFLRSCQTKQAIIDPELAYFLGAHRQ